MAKPFLMLVAGLILGTIVGLWQPRGELFAMREQLAENEKEMASLRRQAGAASIATMFRPRGPVAKPDATPEPGTGLPENPEPQPDGVNVQFDNGQGDEKSADNEINGALADAETMEGVKEALDARAAQARAALLEQTDLDDGQLADFDAAIDRMNSRLQKQIDGLATQLESGQEPSRRELMELGAEGLDAMIEADDAIAEAIPPEERAEIDDELLDPFSHVDGTTMESLLQFDGLAQ